MTEHRRGGLAAWILLALAGLAVAVALSVAASNLSTQPIGLSGEPLRAGEKLAPADVTKVDGATKARPKPSPTFITPSGSRPEVPGDDHGGVDTDHDDD